MKLCKHGLPISLRHDCEYVAARDALIPLAEKYANDHAGPKPPGTRMDNAECELWAARWNTLFHAHMDELWKQCAS